MYLLDANAVIDFFKKRGRVADRMLATPPGEIGLASEGVDKKTRGTQLTHCTALVCIHSGRSVRISQTKDLDPTGSQ